MQIHKFCPSCSKKKEVYPLPLASNVVRSTPANSPYQAVHQSKGDFCNRRSQNTCSSRRSTYNKPVRLYAGSKWWQIHQRQMHTIPPHNRNVPPPKPPPPPPHTHTPTVTTQDKGNCSLFSNQWPPTCTVYFSVSKTVIHFPHLTYIHELLQMLFQS